MNDAHAVFTLGYAKFNEIGKPGSGFVQRHAMQVNLGLYAEAAALQLAHRAFADMLAPKSQGASITVLDGIDVVFKAFVEYLALIRLGEPGFGFGPGFCGGRTRLTAERLGAAHCFVKLIGVVVAHGMVFEAMVCAEQPV